MLSSANSINWGRLAPQIAYYVSAYCDMVAAGTIAQGDKINVCVPTGNFGNILAAYIAKKMGLPVNKFICASNRNNVLTDFFKKGGEYNRNRDFFTTTSPSMDILISSNLERLLFFASDFNDKLVAELMGKLNTEGSYKVAEDVFAKIEAEFDAGCCDDSHAADTINKLWKDENYLCDTHTRSCRSCIRGLPRPHRRRNADRDRVHRVSVQVLPLGYRGARRHARERRRYPAGGALSADRVYRHPLRLPLWQARRRALTAW